MAPEERHAALTEDILNVITKYQRKYHKKDKVMTLHSEVMSALTHAMAANCAFIYTIGQLPAVSALMDEVKQAVMTESARVGSAYMDEEDAA